MYTCSVCNKKLDNHRVHLGYNECIKHSPVEKYSAHIVYPHKTGAFIQPVSSDTSKSLKRIDRRSVSSTRVAKGIYTDDSWDKWLKDYNAGKFKTKPSIGPKGKPLKNKSRPYKMVVWTCIDYYMDNGYYPALDYVKELYKNDKITMMTKTRIVNDITNLQQLPTKLRKKVLKK